MDKFLIKGGKALRGAVAISGAKNSALPAMAAALLTADKVVVRNVPKVRDLVTMSKLLAFMDAKVSVAAALAEGETVLENAAREPEVTDLVGMLRKMGAEICGEGTSTLRIRGVKELHGTEHTVIPDRIEAGTFLIAGAITGGDLTIHNCMPAHLGAVIAKLQQARVRIDVVDATTARVRGAEKLVAADVTTEEYPGFATDMQAQYMALATQAEDTSVITETIFENRYLHASEMVRMGANISINGREAVVRGPAQLTGTTVQASDLRASAGLVLAGLVASGETLIDRVYHIDRGYEGIVEKLKAVGAHIERVHSPGS